MISFPVLTSYDTPAMSGWTEERIRAKFADGRRRMAEGLRRLEQVD